MQTILVVDDDQEVRQMLTTLLGRAGYHVLEAANGRLAFGVFEKHQIDLLITDILMPEKEGIETIIELKKAKPNIGIIAISGGGKGDAGHYLDMARVFGADRMLAKPFDVQELLDTVKELLDVAPIVD